MKPITLEPRSVHIQADRRLVYQVLTAFGNMGLDGYASEVMEDHGDRKLVEFHTPLKIRKKTHVVRSVEWVQLTEPDKDRLLARGRLRRQVDFCAESVGGCLRFGRPRRMHRDDVREPVRSQEHPSIGWILARLMIAPVMRRHMVDHLEDIRGLCEARAERSRVFPQVGCGHGGKL